MLNCVVADVKQGLTTAKQTRNISATSAQLHMGLPNCQDSKVYIRATRGKQKRVAVSVLAWLEFMPSAMQMMIASFPQNKPYLFQSSSPFSFCSCCRNGWTSNGCFLTVATPGSQRNVFRKKRKYKVKQLLDGWLTCEAVKFLCTSVDVTYRDCAVNYVYECWPNDWV